MAFLKECASHMSTFLKARVLRVRLHGVTDVDGSVRDGPAVAVELGLPALQNEDADLLENKFRSAKRVNKGSDDGWGGRLGFPRGGSRPGYNTLEMLGRSWGSGLRRLHRMLY